MEQRVHDARLSGSRRGHCGGTRPRACAASAALGGRGEVDFPSEALTFGPIRPPGRRGRWREMHPKEKSPSFRQGASAAPLVLPAGVLPAEWLRPPRPSRRGPCAAGPSEDAALGVQGPHVALRGPTRAEGFASPNDSLRPHYVAGAWFLATTLFFPLSNDPAEMSCSRRHNHLPPCLFFRSGPPNMFVGEREKW